MRIALAQLNYHIGNFESNTGRIIEAIRRARKEGAGVVVFAEMAVCGYPPRDFLEFDDFIDRCEQSVWHIAKVCTGITAVVGTPTRNPDKKGKKLYNSAVVLEAGKILSVHHKSLLPNYDVFDEYRYFEPALHNRPAVIGGGKAAVTICEDLWNIGNELLYRIIPMDELARHDPGLIINLAASPFHYLQHERRLATFRKNVLKYRLPLVYVNQVGAQTELLFDGASTVMNAGGEVVLGMKCFGEDFRVVDLEEVKKTAAVPVTADACSKTALIHDALVMGIRDYFSKSGFDKAILGLSGGLDSAVTLVLAERALGKENVWGILMPSRFSSNHSLEDSFALAANLGCPHEVIPIEDAFTAFEQSLSPLFKGLPFNIAEENIQARIRGVILMALSNKFGHILLNTSNKSEAAVGYGTLYGDMNGGLSVLGDVYKTEVYELARYINRDVEIIPHNILLKPPSAELRPGQKDSDSLPAYELLDRILYGYIEEAQGPNELIDKGFDRDTVARVLRMVNTSEYKRYQTPPILRVSPKAFGMGRRMPIVGKYLS